jgi:hypothetical protein
MNILVRFKDSTEAHYFGVDESEIEDLQLVLSGHYTAQFTSFEHSEGVVFLELRDVVSIEVIEE